MSNIIGRCFGETSPSKIYFISKEMPAVNEYVYLEYAGKTIMGIIDDLFRGSFTLGDDLLNPETIEKILEFEGDIDHYIRGQVTILGDIDNLEIPRTPAPPGTEVKKATVEQLNKLFGQDGVKIGTVLSEPEVEVKLNANKMVSRHMGILAMTGAGKSNTTSVIIDELLALNGAILIFDMHKEYIDTEFKNGKTKTIYPLINPRFLNIYEYKKLCSISDGATNQERFLREGFEVAKAKSSDGDSTKFIEDMKAYAQARAKHYSEEKTKNKALYDAAIQVQFKLDDMMAKYHEIFKSTDIPDIVNLIELGKANIIPLSSLDEIAMDVVVNHVLSEVLRRRKNRDNKSEGKVLKYPVFCIIEEAHILASQKRNTRSKIIIGKIAREGRKFGVGLCLVSQSPKSLDSDSLSQLNNLIILRLVEPSDQAHVQKSSESLSEDLLKRLPSLNVGEAILLGQMTKVPTMVKIDEFKDKSIGRDLDIVNEWAKAKRNEEEELQKQFDEIDELGI